VSPSDSTKKKREFDPKKFLATIGDGRKAEAFSRKQIIFTQGDAADALFYIQEGKVKLTVVSKIGKEATLGILSEGDFFGEGGLAGQVLRMGSATAMTDCELMRIDKKARGNRLRFVVLDALARPRILADPDPALLVAAFGVVSREPDSAADPARVLL